MVNWLPGTEKSRKLLVRAFYWLLYVVLAFSFFWLFSPAPINKDSTQTPIESFAIFLALYLAVLVTDVTTKYRHILVKAIYGMLYLLLISALITVIVPSTIKDTTTGNPLGPVLFVYALAMVVDKKNFFRAKFFPEKMPNWLPGTEDNRKWWVKGIYWFLYATLFLSLIMVFTPTEASDKENAIKWFATILTVYASVLVTDITTKGRSIPAKLVCWPLYLTLLGTIIYSFIPSAATKTSTPLIPGQLLVMAILFFIIASVADKNSFYRKWLYKTKQMEVSLGPISPENNPNAVIQVSEENYYSLSSNAGELFNKGYYQDSITLVDSILRFKKVQLNPITINIKDTEFSTSNNTTAAPPIHNDLLQNLWLVKGRSYKRLGKIEEALASFKIATLINPKDQEAWLELGKTIQATGRLWATELKNYCDNEYNKIKKEFDYKLDEAEHASLLGNTQKALELINELATYELAVDETTASTFSLSYRTETVEKLTQLKARLETTLPKTHTNIDAFTPTEFEKFIEELFRKKGYNSQRIGGPKDFGADIIAETNGRKTVIQVKHYYENSTNLKAIQEAYSAKTHYNAQHAIVITTSKFTDSAKELAQSTGVELWNRQKLMEEINELLR